MDTLINELFQNNDSNISKDLQLNLKRYATQSSLNEQQLMLLIYSLTQNKNLIQFHEYAKEQLLSMGLTTLQITEAKEIASFVKMLNTYYKFKYFVDKHEDYKQAGLRMNAMSKSNLTKNDFEILALAHSLINGCEFCVKAHENELRHLGVSAEHIHDIARLTSVLNAITEI